MLKNFSTKFKLALVPIVYIVIVTIVTIIFTYYNNVVKTRIQAAEKTDIFIQDVLKGRIAVYQFLRTPNDSNIDNVHKSFETLDDKVKEFKSGLTVQKNIEICDEILKESSEYIEHFDAFAKKRIDEFNNGILNESSEIKPIIVKMAETGLRLEKELNQINSSAKELSIQAESTMNNILIAIAIISIIIFLIFSLVLSNIIISSIEKFKDGLSSFFAYINRETQESKLLVIEGKDEFAMMAASVNESIEKTKIGLNKDNETVKEVLAIVEKANKGYMDQKVLSHPNNPQLVQLCDALNAMLSGLKNRVDSINKILNEFSSYNFTSKLDTKGIEGDMASLVNSLNFLTDEISTLLKQSYTIGLTLDKSSDQLIINVDTLNRSSTEAAASLEETAAALEEITSTIVNNAENVHLMSEYAKNLSSSAKTGQTLAQNTTKAMEDITDQVNSINEAISVIDQIAFQTNILSLNAAVEAATAGEAGKGFAVVAQEVRNLASRSAEAAKEIKELVENATSKAAQGKDISSQMIKGYDELLIDIKKSTEKIEEIANASKEQEQGITQINDAVNQLDQQTQQNALIATQTHDIAAETDAIAKEIVADAQSKEFLGKNKVAARTSAKSDRKESSSASSKHESKKVESHSSKKTEVKDKAITSNVKDDDEWESF
ncbi:methyl-accepting chemotaxis protein [Halarcobacter ebronensis]|uniref:Chemotaxis protein n=1 Tax=Halarcobacter ebronensis TaxID=1462615 RepID=A0A4Q1APY5_9BACT|nr:methyl-accepting chemotaxis protein [Halarcobacter ebronensis]RXK05198.1 chemotaxis protein [Halarcobacter ebronensis]